MNDSQNSDIFLENSMMEDSPPVFDSAPYKLLLTKTIKFLTTEIIFKEPAFAQNFSSCLEDCCICVCECLEIIGSSVVSTEIQSIELQNSLKDVIFLLQKLSCFLKNLIESITLSCATLKTFPITTGKIILNVFTHCKYSENLYQNHLKVVETELKGLFCTCHELQQTYLLILENHFIFDMMEEVQQCILIKALDINLKISHIVQTLDVKTLAEQLKSYTGICKKYSDSLLDKDIYNQCTELLCGLIDSNLKIALEFDQQDKVVIRSLKVASFVIKMLLRISDIFKYGRTNKYENVLQILINIFLCDGAILGGMLNKSPQFISQVNSLILKTTQDLLSQLLLDKRFIDCLLRCDKSNVSEDKQLGLILLTICTIRCSVQGTEVQTLTVPKNKLIDYVLDMIPYSQGWLNSGLMFHKDGDEAQSLEDYLLSHLVALSMCFNGEEFATLEVRLCGAVLSDNSSSAFFSSRLWVLLASVADPQYTMPTVTTLCRMYENLETNAAFLNSPQEVHLGQIINQLFEILPDNYKVSVTKIYEITEKHYNIWTNMKIKNLPESIRVGTEESLLDKLLVDLNRLNNSERYEQRDVRRLIKILKITSTCSFTVLNCNVGDSVVKAWAKACPKNMFPLPSNIDCGSYWYFAYIQALLLLTKQIIEQFDYFENFVAVFHVLSELILSGNNELMLLLMPTYCKISLYYFSDEHGASIDPNTIETFEYLLLKTEPLVQQYALGELITYKDEKKFKSIVGKIIEACPELQKTWRLICDIFNCGNINERKKRWMESADCTYRHQCMERKALEGSVRTKQRSNFEMDIENIFRESDAEEPANKKAKTEEDTSDIVKRIEKDSLLLSRTDISDECKKRILVVCDRLRNII